MDDPSKSTLNSMVAIATSEDANTLSFVRKPSRHTEPAIMVVMIESEALRHLGPFLLEFARKLGDNKPTTILDLKPDDPVEFVFKWMESEGLQWAYDARPAAGVSLLTMLSFVGPACYELAPELTARGCPTSLS
jgi:hypothetical protein